MVRWAYLYGSPPGRTSLCALFWRTVFITPVLKLTVPGVFIAALGLKIWEEPWHAAMVFGVVTLIIGALVIGIWFVERLKRRADEEPPPSVVRDGFRAIKSKVCPLVELCETESHRVK